MSGSKRLLPVNMGRNTVKNAIFVTGASTGIGRALVESWSAKGLYVFAGVRDQKSENELKSLAHVCPVICDVTREETLQQALSQVREKLAGQPLAGLVNNAGVVFSGPIEAVSIDHFRRQFEVNVFGLIAVTQKFLPLLRSSRGRVVNIGSISGRIAAPFLGPYCASKFALEAVTDSLRRETAELGVKVVLVDPGPVNTPIWDKSKRQGLEHKAEMPQEILTCYEPALSRFEKNVERAARGAVEAQEVVRIIEMALSIESPRTRYFVGKGIGLQNLLSRVLPDQWLDALIHRALR